MRAAVDDSMPDRVQMWQLQPLELVEQRIDRNLRTLKLTIGFGERAPVGVVDPDLAANRPNPVSSAFSNKRFDAAGNRVQRELARRRTDVDAQDDVTSLHASFLS